MLRDSITNSTLYLTVARRKYIVGEFLALKSTLCNVNSASDNTDSISLIRDILKPKCRLFDKEGGFSEEISKELKSIGVHSIVHTPGEVAVSLSGEISVQDFNDQFNALTISEHLEAKYKQTSPGVALQE